MKVSFNCGKDSIGFFTDVLGALKDCSKPVKVRVGGFETHFININSISKLTSIDTEILTSIEFYADDISFGFFNNFLHKIENFRKNNNSCKIRIGGKEFHFSSIFDIDDIKFEIFSDTASTTFINCTDDDDNDDNDDGDSDEVIAVKEIIADKISNDIMFTAFDITKELRKNGHKVRHSNIRNIVHGLFYNGDITGYTRTITEVNGERPFVYHPISSDASNYND